MEIVPVTSAVIIAIPVGEEFLESNMLQFMQMENEKEEGC